MDSFFDRAVVQKDSSPGHRLAHSTHVRDWRLKGRVLCIPVLGLRRCLGGGIAVEVT